MGNTVETTPLRYHGYSSKYVDIATRGTEHLGLSIAYGQHPASSTGAFVVRFVAHGNGVTPSGFTHLQYREPGKYQTFGPHSEGFTGVRLNKFAIKAFSPAIYPHELAQYLDQFNMLPLLEEWIAEQAAAEGFTITVDLAKEIRTELIPVLPVTKVPVASVLEFPNLVEQPKPVLKLVEPTEEEEETEGDDDTPSGGPDDDEDDDKPWLN